MHVVENHVAILRRLQTKELDSLTRNISKSFHIHCGFVPINILYILLHCVFVQQVQPEEALTYTFKVLAHLSALFLKSCPSSCALRSRAQSFKAFQTVVNFKLQFSSTSVTKKLIWVNIVLNTTPPQTPSQRYQKVDESIHPFHYRIFTLNSARSAWTSCSTWSWPVSLLSSA